MNERIRQLAEQANANELSYAYYRGEKRPENAVTLHSVDLEKFAELIVRECMEVVIDGQYSATECEGNSHRISYNNGRYGASLDIKKHFGVEE